MLSIWKNLVPVFTAVGLFASLAGEARAQSAVVPDLRGVTLTFVTQSPYYLPVFEKAGLLKDAPYKVDFAVVTGTSAVVSTLLSGAADLGTLGDFSLILAQANSKPQWTPDDLPLRNVLALAPADPVNFPLIVTLAGKDSNIKSFADIKGKKFSYTPGGSAHLQYLLTLKKAGLTPADVQPVQLDFGVGATALANGNVDVITNNIQSSQAAFDGGATILATSADVGMPAYNTITANADSLKDPKRLAAIRDFLGRYIKFNLWAIQNAKDVEAVYISAVKQNPKQAKLSWLSGRQIPVLVDDQLLATEQGIADTITSYGLAAKPIDVKGQYDRQFNDIIANILKETDYAQILAASVKETAPH